ncbi:MAG: thioredoxin family protein [Chloroflexota bacterium]|nr:thioredoxin family protein [Chloroflexota bacterium]
MSERSTLAAYARDDLRGGAILRGYRPRSAVLDQLKDALPSAHLLVISGAWCGDCRREVPKLARIMEELPPPWTVELRHDDAETRTRYNVLAIPTFIVLDRPGGRELGRIIESPSSPDGLEGDLLAIARTARLTRAG